MEKLVVASSLLTLAAVAWLLTVLQLTPMIATPALYVDPVDLSLFAVSWTFGMVAMMFPTAVPMILMLFRVGRSATNEIRTGGGPTLTKAFLFTLAYISLWGATGILIYVGAAGVSSFLWPSLYGFLGSGLGISFALILVGIYQLSPLKGECLDKCHPASFLFRYYRGGILGSVKMGGLYAKYCVGCCWVMMIFLLLVGAMGSLWMALFALLIFVERVVFQSAWTPKVLGAILLLSGMALLVSQLS